MCILDVARAWGRILARPIPPRGRGATPRGVVVAPECVMRNRHEVLASNRIPNAYDVVRETWLKDPLGILQRATTTGLSGLFGAKLRVLVGPLEISGEIVVDIIAIEQCHSPDGRPATRLVVEWGAMRSPELFPVMHATLSMYPLTAAETALEFRGVYEPPLGLVGEAADAVAMHHVAKESVAHFVGDIARLLGVRISKGTAA